jgi:hypothetical protein
MAAVPPPSGRIGEGDDEMSGAPVHEGRLGRDLQVRGPAVPPLRQAAERNAFGDGRGWDVGGGDETLGPRQRQVMRLLGGEEMHPIPQERHGLVPVPAT